ncbi:Arginine utilization regulatory protein RocR [[Clostridium] ultunense Esp]|nr:Arginine utilization regulatory protein RocR [[Clostridium] ultunense Esp]
MVQLYIVVIDYGGTIVKNNRDVLNMDYVDAIMIVDQYGRIVYSVRFNPRFDKDGCEGDFESIINKNFLEVYPSIDPKESTMIDCIQRGRPVFVKEQQFKDYKGRTISTQNLTIPIIRSGKTLGAIELSKDITKIEEKIVNKTTTRPIIFKSENFDQKAMYNFDDIITSNKEMLRNIERAKLIADTPSSVLVYGETGTGKELYVQSIHNYSSTKNKPFVAQNCAALPENLFESILFGSVKGAFTGAVDRPGLFEVAHGGTLFLDEINSMPQNLQAKLLRVLQDGKVRRVGDNRDREVDVRIITAMNVEPTKAIELGQLREDLFYRISVVNIKLLPLRERKEDILLYIDHFIKFYNDELGKDVTGVSKGVEELFLKYDWPGNVREIEHVIESSINFAQKGEIKLVHLPVYLSEKVIEKESNQDENYYIEPSMSLDDVIEKIEKEMIMKALEKSGGNISRAASLLKITRQRLHYKLSKYNLESF